MDTWNWGLWAAGTHLIWLFPSKLVCVRINHGPALVSLSDFFLPSSSAEMGSPYFYSLFFFFFIFCSQYLQPSEVQQPEPLTKPSRCAPSPSFFSCQLPWMAVQNMERVCMFKKKDSPKHPAQPPSWAVSPWHRAMRFPDCCSQNPARCPCPALPPVPGDVEMGPCWRCLYLPQWHWLHAPRPFPLGLPQPRSALRKAGAHK